MEARAPDGARLCVETFGDAGASAILLIAGAAAPMDLWDEELCGRLAAAGRFVVRYDHRDTGRSTTSPPGAPGYTGDDLVEDALAVLDAVGVRRAHVAGLSMGGGIAQTLALTHRERIASLTLIATTAIDFDSEALPGMSAELRAAFADPPPEPDYSDREAVVEHLVETERRYASPGDFDAARVRAYAERVHDRSIDVAAAANHWAVASGDAVHGPVEDLGGLPTLVVHGTEDPLFPIEHGRALAARIPGARLLELEGVGHQLPPPRTWDRLVEALVAHTA